MYFEYPETLEGLEQAKKHLERLEERDSMDTSGNPDKYHTRINSARMEVRRITESLKAQGLLPYTEQELLNHRLDEAFPKAKSREIVEFEGARYQKRFSPATKSRSGKTVTSWNQWWQKLPDVD
ncbi:hypothetical protein C8N32_101314 [Rhodovulum imhoffii]|uniref:Uncharacterized protein n=1 Tax=Rhodovulum imhoffii TaxID=365340 RepID=A0A2T5BWS1_9RHOB|nr:hypothetical protein [Rhodovulum imhoffii]MBK5933354.1 hypothetical protein [Rhodovulum imhoffii]PTN04115.1 hypothetical protein C8N32_101314 [Rhodovulum imhoffii]